MIGFREAVRQVLGDYPKDAVMQVLTECMLDDGADQKQRRRPSKRSNYTSVLKKYSLGWKFPGVYFTRREAEVVSLVIKGYTVKTIAEILKLSPRTIEYYLKNIKSKTFTNRKGDLIAVVLGTDFVSHIDFHIEVLPGNMMIKHPVAAKQEFPELLGA